MTDEQQKQFNDYGKFVISTTSDESLRTETMIDRLYGLKYSHPNTEFSQLLTASIGMQAESGEFSEIIKRLYFRVKNSISRNVSISCVS